MPRPSVRRRRGALVAALVVAVVVPSLASAPARAAEPAPVVTGVAPAAGPTSGGRTVTITGTGLTGATAVRFGVVPAASFTVSSATRITATTPADVVGVVDVRVTTAAGTSAIRSAARYTFAGTYAVTGVLGAGVGRTAHAVDPTTGTLYLLDGARSRLVALDDVTGKVRAAVKIPAQVGGSSQGLQEIAVDTASHTVYVTEPDAGKVWIVDGTTATVTRAAHVDIGSHTLAVDPTTHRVYVSSWSTGALQVVSGTKVVKRVALPAGISDVGVDPTRHTVYVTNRGAATVAVVDGHAATVTATLPTAPDSLRVAVDPITHTAYVSSFDTGELTVVRGAAVVATLPAGLESPIAVDPTRGLVFGFTDTSLRVVDAATGALRVSTALHGQLAEIVVDPGTHRVFVLETLASQVDVVAPASVPTVLGVSPSSGPLTGGQTVTITGVGFTAASTVRFGAAPATSVTLQSSTRLTAVAPAGTVGRTDVRVIGRYGPSPVVAGSRFTYTGSYVLTATVAVGDSPGAVAVDPDRHRAYVTNQGGASVSLVDTATNRLETTVAVGNFPSGVAVDPTRGIALVANHGDSSVTTIYGRDLSPFGPQPVGSPPVGVAVDPGTGLFWTARENGSILGYDPGTDHSAVGAVGSDPSGVAVDPISHDVYATSRGDGTLSIRRGDGTRLTVSGVGVAPSGVAVDGTTGFVYVTDQATASVTVVDRVSATVVGTIPVGTDPWGVTVDPVTHTAYVMNFSDDTVSVIDTVRNTVNATVAVPGGSYPAGAAVDPTTHVLYVAEDTDALSVITPTA